MAFLGDSSGHSLFSQCGKAGNNEETKRCSNTWIHPWDNHHTSFRYRWQADVVASSTANKPPSSAHDLTRRILRILQIPNSPAVTLPVHTRHKYIVSATDPAYRPESRRTLVSTSRTSGEHWFITADQPGKMDIAFQILMPGFNYDLGHSGKGPSEGWFFFTSYNSEQANTKLETNASQNDKDYIAAVHYAKAEQCVAEGKAKTQPAEYFHNYMEEGTRQAKVERKTSVRMLNPSDCPGVVYYLPTPKSPHGVDIDPTGEYIVAGGNRASYRALVTKMTRRLRQGVRW